MANLPKDITTCDGNTIQGSTILVANDGSFSDPATRCTCCRARRSASNRIIKPICNQTNYCVLYVGQDQNDFTAPKVFSAPFLISPSSGTTTTTTAANGLRAGVCYESTTVAPATSASHVPTRQPRRRTSDIGHAALRVTLANTGPPAKLAWVAASGMALLLTGAMGRRLALRRGR